MSSDVQPRNVKILVKRLSQEEIANEKKTDYSLRSADQSLTDTNTLNISSLTPEQINEIVGVKCTVDCKKLEVEETYCMKTKRKRSVQNSNSSSPKNIPKKQKKKRCNGTY